MSLRRLWPSKHLFFINCNWRRWGVTPFSRNSYLGA